MMIVLPFVVAIVVVAVVFVAFGGLTDGLTDNCLIPIISGLFLTDLGSSLASLRMK